MTTASDTKIQKAAGSPKVSIIIPSYNTAHFIGETLDSICAQTFNDYEVIVINDGSPDTEQLERVLRPYQDLIIYRVKPNGGLSSARNAGIELARGQYIALLDSDDVWEPDYLAVQVAALDADPSVEVSYANAMIFGDSLDAGKDYMSIFPSKGEVTFQSLVQMECNVLVSALIRRKALDRVGLFDESLRTNEDFDMWLRIVQSGGRFIYHRRPLWRYRKRGGALSADPVVMWAGALRVLEKARRELDLSAADRAVVDRRCQYARAMMQFCDGKRAFFAGDFAAASAALAEANTLLQSRKLALAMRGMRLAPRLLLKAYQVRDRFVYGMNTRF
jgi:glycosyltransferase involved in cell wall biosynthesis